MPMYSMTSALVESGWNFTRLTKCIHGVRHLVDVARLVAARDSLFALVTVALITLLIPPGGELNNVGRYTAK